MRPLMPTIIKIGTRGSRLALWQAQWVKSQLEARNTVIEVQIVIIKTKGDKILDAPLAAVGGKGLFVKEIEQALMEGKIDLAVHSMKDMPADIPAGLCIGAIPRREIPYDVLVSNPDIDRPFSDLKKGARIGTCSLRRAAQLLHVRPDFEIVPIRGNLDTRLKKLENDHLDAIVLAAAGVKRMGYENRITEIFDEKVMLPAVGQGALCIETRVDDPFCGPLVQSLDDDVSRIVVLGERAFLHRLEGGCQVPIAALGKMEKDKLIIEGLVASLDGKTLLKETVSGDKTDYHRLGVQLGERLLGQGADKIMATVYQTQGESNGP
jgi:hydroxymethylbilane synthase